MSDDTEKFYELHDEFARDAQAYQDAAGQPLPGSATDPSGAVTVAIDSDGVFTVAVTEQWRSHYEPNELAGGIMTTLQELAAQRTAAWATNVEGALDEDRPSRPTPAPSETTAGKLKAIFDASPDSAAEMTSVLENVLAFLEDVTDNFDATFAEAAARGTAPHRSESDSQHLTVVVNAAGELQAVELSENWVSRTTGSQISREINEAIAQARAEGGTSGGQLDGTSLAKYQRFIDDPDSFVQFVRGKE